MICHPGFDVKISRSQDFKMSRCQDVKISRFQDLNSAMVCRLLVQGGRWPNGNAIAGGVGDACTGLSDQISMSDHVVVRNARFMVTIPVIIYTSGSIAALGGIPHPARNSITVLSN